MIHLLGPCGTFAPSSVSTCDACGRRIRCVYTVDDAGWTFLLGRRCHSRLVEFLGLPEMNRLRNDNPPTLIDDGFLAEPEPAPEPPAKPGCLALLLVAVLWLVVG